MIRKILLLSLVMGSVSFTTYCFAGVFDDLKTLKEAEKIKQENEGLKQENANLKQQLANAKKVSYQNIAQGKYKTMVSIVDNYLIDGDKKTANLTPKWYELDFNYSRVIDKVIIYLTPAEKLPNIDLSFYVYDEENQRWNNLKTINNEGKNVLTLTFSPLNTSKLKICPTINSTTPLVILPIAEIEVFGWVVEE